MHGHDERRDTLWLPNLCACCGASPAPHLHPTSGAPYAGTILELTFPYCDACRDHARWVSFKQSPLANALARVSIFAGVVGGGILGALPSVAATAIAVAIAGMMVPWYVAKLGDLTRGRRHRACAHGACVSHVRVGAPGSGVRVRFEFANHEFERAFRVLNASLQTHRHRRARCQFIVPEGSAAA